MFTVELIGKTELLARVTGWTAAVIAEEKVAVTRQTIELQAHVIRDKLSGQVLNVRSGDLRRSIQEEAPLTEGTGVFGRVFSSGDVKYARIHEYGGRTAPHDIVPNKAEALAFMIGGKQVFAKVVHHPGSQMPERSFLRSALADRAVEIGSALKEAAVRGLQVRSA